VQVLKTPKAQVIVEVAEDDGTPVPAAKVNLAASLSTTGGDRSKDGFTGTDGRISLTVSSVDGQVKGAASKRGYYTTDTAWISLQSGGSDQFKPLKEGKWGENGRLLKIPLRPIKNPVPMYVKNVFLVFPNPGQWTGYDLEVGDWVAPYGKGRVSDLEFAGAGTWESSVEYDGTLTMRIPGDGNGIQALDISPDLQYCQFKSPYEAPEDGYLKEWRWRKSAMTRATARTKGMNVDDWREDAKRFIDEKYPNRMFIFRVRAEVDEWGRVIKAQYGKIYGPVESLVGNHGKGHVSFTHYLNPDYTRNLEYAPKQNLFPRESHKGQEYYP
jgi:hypothetical protein